MSGKPSKFKMNIKEGTIEIDGEEEFVKEMLKEYLPVLSTTKTQSKPKIVKTEVNGEKGKRRTSKGGGTSFTIIPLDLTSGADHPSLRDFYTEKNPKSNLERPTLFVYYLSKYKGIHEVLPGHLIACYQEVGAKKPVRPDQSIRDVTSGKGWLAAGTTVGTAILTISGENLIEHDLPRSK